MTAVVKMELLVESRNPSAFFSAVLFSLLALLTLSLSYPSSAPDPESAFAVFFVAAFFSALLGENVRTARDKKSGIGSMLALSPSGAPGIFAARVTVSTAMMLLTEIFLFPFLLILYNVPVGPALAYAVPIAILAASALSALLTLFGVAGGAWKGAGGALALPILILPLAFPILALASVGCGRAFDAMPVAPFIKLLLASNVALIGIGAATYGKLLGRQ